MNTQSLPHRIGAALRAARKLLELSQEDAAERLGISAEFYGRIERGNASPSIETFARMVPGLGLDCGAIFGVQGGEVPAPLIEHKDPPNVRAALRALRKANPRTVSIVRMVLREMDTRPTAMTAPGDSIGTCACPRCGATLAIEHGDDEGEIGVTA